MLSRSRLLQNVKQRISLILLLFHRRIKGYWSVAFMSLGKQTSRWIVTHELAANILSIQRADVLYPNEGPLLLLPSSNRRLSNNQRKPPRYRSASLGNEPVTIVVTTVRSWCERLSTCPSFEVPGHQLLYAPRVHGKLLREVAQGKCSRHEQTVVTTIVTGSSPRLTDIAQTYRSISWRLPSVVSRAYRWPWQR